MVCEFLETHSLGGGGGGAKISWKRSQKKIEKTELDPWNLLGTGEY